jgi:Leucine-rich repeat (LRR) protein
VDIFDDASKLCYLQTALLAQNEIKELPEILLLNLLTLDLARNQIASAPKFTGHPKLRVLELRKNRLTSFAGIKNLPQLQDLFAAENELATLEGLEALPALKRLHIRKNPVPLLRCTL